MPVYPLRDHHFVRRTLGLDTIATISALFSPVMNFALQQSGIPVIREIRIRNTTGRTLSGLTVSVTSDPAIFRAASFPVEEVRPRADYEILSPELQMYASTLITLTAAQDTVVRVSLLLDGETVADVESTVRLLAYDEWAGAKLFPETTGAYVQPGHPYIADLMKLAGAELKHLARESSFPGYKKKDPGSVLKQMEAIFRALQGEKFRVKETTAGYDDPGQRIRLPETLKVRRECGTLDLALLFAACLEAADLNPIVVFEKRTCYVGVWLIDTFFSESIQDDPTQLTKRTADGIEELAFVSLAGFSEKSDFSAALASANARLSDEDRFWFALDLRRVRAGGILPMPLRRLDAKGNPLFDFVPSTAKRQGEAVDPAGARRTVKRTGASEMTREQMWERKLLDLSLRNTLLNFSFYRSSVQILVGQPEELFDPLTRDDVEYSVLGLPKEPEIPIGDGKGLINLRHAADPIRNFLRSEFRQRRIHTTTVPDELSGTLNNLFRNAKTGLEESGANTLYLAFGFLRWYETNTSQKPHYAPLVLLPVELVRASVRKDFLLRAREDEPRFNITLLEMLRNTFGVTIPDVDPLPQNENGERSLRDVFSAVRNAVMKMSRWDISESVVLSNFSFANFIMYNDLRRRSADLKANKVVSSLLTGRLTWRDTDDFLPPEQLDSTVNPVDVAAPLPADSSQLSAVCAAGEGKTFVLHGPPGTGKSQTITNMITNALYHGKSVLFIAEKMAALSVVQKRLEAIGIAPFCLELHSNKAKKADVLGQLDRTLQSAKIKTPEEFTAEAERLRRLRTQLNETVSAIGRVRPFGFSLYDAIVRFEQYKDAPDIKIFSTEAVSNLTADAPRRHEAIIGKLRVAADAVGGVHKNPFAIYQKRDYSLQLKQRFAESLKKLAESGADLQKNLVALARLIPFRNLHTYQQIKSISELCAILSEVNLLPAGLTTNKNLPLNRERILDICHAGQARDDLHAALLSRFSEGILNFDAATNLQRIKQAQSRSPITGFFRRRSICRRLATFGKTAKPCRTRETVKILNDILKYQESARTVRENNLCEVIFGEVWDRGRCDFRMLEQVFLQAVDIIRLCGEICTNPENRSLVLVKIGALTEEGMFAERTALFRQVTASFNAFISAEDELAALCENDPARWRALPGWMINQKKLAETCLQKIDTLRDWNGYLGVREEAEKAGLGVLCQALEAGKIEPDQLIPTYRRNLAYACAAFVIDGEEALSGFNGALVEEKIRQFAKINANFENLTKQELAAMLSSKIPNAMDDASASSEISILQRAIRSGGRGTAIRKLFDSIPNLLRCLCPCMLMSPISVAQYIDPSFPKFDLVIFDEASQMPTCEAVGAIARGNDLIVVGDPKQLPPTSFFATVRNDEDNIEKEDLESILDDCLALGMPEEHLRWHYRSRHESLIAFSNRQYYDNKLYTFPSPNDRVSRVSHVKVDGFYDRGKSKTNKAEAQAVVAEIVRRLKKPELAKQSIGVVTFSSVQQLLIEDLLEAEFRKNQKLEEAALGMYEPIFIKNLENVQGDERDVIMFSVCYGPDKNGQVAMNFGPLNREGGWRRLNVATSRARREMIVFSTLLPEQIDLNRTTSEGVIGLRSFLSFAMSGNGNLPTRPGDRTSEDGIAENVAAALRQLGYEVDTHVGCSEYKIDIAIRDPLREGEYLLGILCDGEHAGQETAHDRLILQDEILASLGWKIHRLWLLDWWDAPAKELEKIRNLAEEAKLRPILYDTPAPAAPAPTVFETVARTEHRREADVFPVYPVAEFDDMDETMVGGDAFCDVINKTRIVMQMDKILHLEGPVSRTTLVKRLLTAWGIPRTSPKIERSIDEKLRFIDHKTTQTASNHFYWLSDPESTPVSPRIPDPADPKGPSRRDFNDIPTEEIAAAVRSVVTKQYSLTTEDLYKEVSRIFGYARMMQAMVPYLAEGVTYASSHGWVAELNGRIFVKVK